jgi:hypothetical protein
MTHYQKGKAVFFLQNKNVDKAIQDTEVVKYTYLLDQSPKKNRKN